ncbi:MAG: dockerin type I repeat-containing protein [Clostridia bacterium]|nr:dockerin type I repeat-containing protein [Clostridia bacterium]
MKKLIAIMLAVATLSFSASVMAATETSEVKKNGSVNGTFAISPDAASMPSFEADDTITFTVIGAKNGGYVTLLSSQEGADLQDSTVQYIDQYETTGSTQDVEYVIRDLDEGVYNLKIKVDDNEIYTVYYKVGGEEPGILYGDVNGDGEFTAKDVAYLARYLAGWKDYQTIDETKSDANADGKVNALDNIILARSSAKWVGYTTLPYTK